MGKHGKKYNAVKEKMSVEKLYTVEEAIQFLKDNPTAVFDESMEIALRMGVDTTKSDQAIRSTVALPHGTGKDVRVIVFASGDAAKLFRRLHGDVCVGVARVADNQNFAIRGSELTNGRTLNGENLGVLGQQVLALHAGTARSGANQQCNLCILEGDVRVVGVVRTEGDDDTLSLTTDGRKWMRTEMAKEIRNEVS